MAIASNFNVAFILFVTLIVGYADVKADNAIVLPAPVIIGENSEVVQFDTLPREIQQQVVEALHKEHEQVQARNKVQLEEFDKNKIVLPAPIIEGENSELIQFEALPREIKQQVVEALHKEYEGQIEARTKVRQQLEEFDKNKIVLPAPIIEGENSEVIQFDSLPREIKQQVVEGLYKEYEQVQARTKIQQQIEEFDNHKDKIVLPAPIIEGENSELIQFDSLPREIKQQVVEALHKDYEEQVQARTKVRQQLEEFDKNKIVLPAPVIVGENSELIRFDSLPREIKQKVVEGLYKDYEEQVQARTKMQQQLEEFDKNKIVLPAPIIEGENSELIQFDSLPREIKQQVVEALHREYEEVQARTKQQQKKQEEEAIQQQKPSADNDPSHQLSAAEQQQPTSFQKDKQEIISTDAQLAQVLTRMSVDDGHGNQLVNMESLPEEFKNQLADLLIKQQQEQEQDVKVMEENQEESKQQEKQPAENTDKQAGSQLGGILGTLIGGAVGGYPAQGYPQGGYPGGYPGGGYPGGYPGAGYPGAGYPGAGYPGGGYPGGSYPQQGGYPGAYPGAGYPQHGGYPGGVYGNHPNRPMAYRGKPYLGLNVPHVYQSSAGAPQRPYGIIVTREQLAAMMSGAEGSLNDGDVVLAQPNFWKHQTQPQVVQDPYADFYQRYYQPETPDMKYDQYRYHPAAIQQRRPPFPFRPYPHGYQQSVGNPYFY